MPEETEDRKPTKREPESSEEMRTRFILELSTDADAVQDQSQAAEEDLRFLNVIGGMWEGFFENELIDRVKLQFPMIANFLNRIQAEWNMNRVGVEYKPGDDLKTSDKDAELLNGVHRADFRVRGNGKKAIDNAVLEVMHCGYGCYELGEAFIDRGDKENDLQRIEWRSLFDAYNTVYWHDASQMIDKSDAKRVTKLKRFTRKSFLAEFPDDDPVSAYTPTRWFFDDNLVTTQDDVVWVATRYEVVEEEETVFVYHNLLTLEVQTFSEERHEEVKNDLKNVEFLQFVRERKIVRRRIEKSVFTGAAFLEEPRRISGEYLPIIAVYGHRIYVDGAEWYKGFVRDLKDASRLLNQQLSQLSENAAGSSREIPIFDPKQVEDPAVKSSWAGGTNEAYKLAKMLTDDDGKVIASGPLGYVKPAQLDGSTAALIQLVPQLIKDFTGGAPQETVDPNTSGKAIVAARKIQDLMTQPVMENIAAAIEWSGVVYASKVEELYSTSRVIRIIGKDGSESTVELMRQSLDEETGEIIQTNDITNKKFRAYADIGPQFETQKQETTDTALRMIETLAPIQGAQAFIPELVGVAIENMAGTGLDSIKKMNRKIRLLAGTIDPDTDEDKQIIAEAQKKQAQTDPQEKLIEAATQQQLSESRNLDSASAEKLQSAELKAAQTRKTLSDIEINQAKTASDIRVNEAKTLKEIRESIFKPLERVPV